MVFVNAQLLAPGALIIADNVLFKGKVLNSAASASAAATSSSKHKEKKASFWARRHQVIC